MSELADAVNELRTNQEQWAAFTAEGHTVVLAPPGSGKTQLLTARAATDLREHDTGPRGAACITMTNEAALEMSRRMGLFGVQHRPNLFVGTVHSFALGRIVAPFAAAAGEDVLADSTLISDDESEQILEGIYSTSSLNQEDFGNIKTTVNRIRQRMDFSGDRRLGGPTIARLAQEYSDTLRAQRLYDFPELVSWAVQLVEEHQWIRRVLTACFPRIYVDEYQDLAPGLDRIVRAITIDAAETGSSLFAVGDPDQSIFAFAGAHPELLRSLANDPRTGTISLKTNYRSGQKVIDSAVRVLGEQRVIAGQNSGGTIHVYAAAGGVQAQSATAVGLVQNALNAGTPAEEIAVLASWNADREAVAEALRGAGIPCFSRSQLHWRSTPATVLVERLGAWALYRGGATMSLGLLLDQLPVISGLSASHRARVAVTRVLVEASESTRVADFLEDLSVALTEDRKLRARLDGGFVGMTDAYLDAGLLSGQTLSDLAQLSRTPGHVMVATIHASKGLEFDHVVVVGVDEQVMPGWNADAAKWEEARRLFYVAITRARHAVEVVYTDSRWSKRTNKPYRVNPSPLLANL